MRITVRSYDYDDAVIEVDSRVKINEIKGRAKAALVTDGLAHDSKRVQHVVFAGCLLIDEDITLEEAGIGDGDVVVLVVVDTATSAAEADGHNDSIMELLDLWDKDSDIPMLSTEALAPQLPRSGSSSIDLAAAGAVQVAVAPAVLSPAGGSGSGSAASRDYSYSVAIFNKAGLPAQEYLNMILNACNSAVRRPHSTEHPMRYTWTERGWNDEEEFNQHCLSSMRKYGAAYLMRAATRKECMDVLKLLLLHQIPAKLIGPGAGPELRSKAELGPPPKRQPFRAAIVNTEPGGDPIYSVSIQSKIEADSSRHMGEQIVRALLRRVQGILQAADPPYHEAPFKLVERGWKNGKEQFLREFVDGFVRRRHGLVCLNVTRRQSELVEMRLKAIQAEHADQPWEVVVHGPGKAPHIDLLYPIEQTGGSGGAESGHATPERDGLSTSDSDSHQLEFLSLTLRIGGQELLDVIFSHHQGPPPASRDIVDSLPVFKITQEQLARMEHTAEDDDGPSCSICFCEFEVGEDATELPCGHIFHPESCVKKWLKEEANTCPVCRKALPSADAEAERLYKATREPDDPTSPWTCTGCTLVNMPPAAECSSCGVHRGLSRAIVALEDRYFREIVLAITIRKHLNHRSKAVAVSAEGAAPFGDDVWTVEDVRQGERLLEREFARLLGAANGLDQRGLRLSAQLALLFQGETNPANLFRGLPPNSQVLMRRLLALLAEAPEAEVADPIAVSGTSGDSSQHVAREPRRYRHFPLEHAALPTSRIPKFPDLLVKLAEWSNPESAVPQELRLARTEIGKIAAMVVVLEDPDKWSDSPVDDAAVSCILDKVLQWPAPRTVPALDLIRMLLRTKDGTKICVAKLPLLLNGLARIARSEVHSKAIDILVPRCIAMLFYARSTADAISDSDLNKLLFLLQRPTILAAITDEEEELIVHPVAVTLANAAIRCVESQPSAQSVPTVGSPEPDTAGQVDSVIVDLGAKLVAQGCKRDTKIPIETTRLALAAVGTIGDRSLAKVTNLVLTVGSPYISDGGDIILKEMFDDLMRACGLR